MWSNRFIKLVAASTVLLITAGRMVTSTGSGLAVPDWPNTYGEFMFSFPAEKMVRATVDQAAVHDARGIAPAPNPLGARS